MRAHPRLGVGPSVPIPATVSIAHPELGTVQREEAPERQREHRRQDGLVVVGGHDVEAQPLQRRGRGDEQGCG